MQYVSQCLLGFSAFTVQKQADWGEVDWRLEIISMCECASDCMSTLHNTGDLSRVNPIGQCQWGLAPAPSATLKG